MKDLLPLLELVAKTKTSLLIIAGDIDGEALATMVVNRIRGLISCAAVRAPGIGDRRKAMMEDIAILTGARFFSEEIGVPLTSVHLDDLGKADKVVVGKHETAIFGGKGRGEQIQKRVRSLRTQIDIAVSAIDREKLQERLAKIVGTLAVLKAGGLSESEIMQQRYRLESALHSTRSAVEYGWVVGGGIALLRAGAAAASKTTQGLNAQADESVASVLEEPVAQLAENGQKSPSEVVAEILRSDSPSYGFDATHGSVVDLIGARVLDAARPLETALKVSISQAASVLGTGSWGLDMPSASNQSIDPRG